ncbi:hypothetical protein [Lysobacter humi (ex Lee et al. 2017)]
MRLSSLLLTGLLIAVPASAAQRVTSIPAAFQGEWNSMPKQCGSALDDSRLVISAGTIQWYESRGPVRAVVAQGAREIALIAELSGEGERWLSMSHFRLDASGRKLTDVSNEATPVVRHRCPRKAR